jgi:2-polyprenyl-6-methoxyphenol hydroxylase-like FAD-dependent oxidoreductase
MRADFDADVIVAGAGPSGLMTACEVALGGGRVIVLEKRGGPTWARSGTLMPRVMEILGSRGLVDRVLTRAREIHANPFARRGIWAGLQPLNYEVLDTEYPYVLMFAQIETERLLAERLRELGGDLRLRSEVLGFAPDNTGVEVRYHDPDGGERRLGARYLVGADGNKSMVRQAAGIAFIGTPARRIAVNVDAYAANPFEDVLTVRDSEAGWAMSYPLKDGVMRFAMIDAATCADAPDRPLVLEDAKAMLRRVHGTDYGITHVDAINRFHDALYLADRLREGRVFLVGEAVRVHYPASGVGMNFCLQDAFNLGWKLAAAVTGRASPRLLDSYESERLPEIQNLLDDVRRQCAIQFNFDPEHVALKRFIEHDLLPIADVNRALCENLSGLSVRYSSPTATHDVVGRRLPNLPTQEGGVFALLRQQDFVLLDLTGAARLPVPAPGMRLKVAAASPARRPALDGLASVLLRPDGYIAWVSEEPLAHRIPEAEIREWLNIAPACPLFVDAMAATDPRY